MENNYEELIAKHNLELEIAEAKGRAYAIEELEQLKYDKIILKESIDKNEKEYQESIELLIESGAKQVFSLQESLSRSNALLQAAILARDEARAKIAFDLENDSCREKTYLPPKLHYANQNIPPTPPSISDLNPTDCATCATCDTWDATIEEEVGYALENIISSIYSFDFIEKEFKSYCSKIVNKSVKSKYKIFGPSYDFYNILVNHQPKNSKLKNFSQPEIDSWKNALENAKSSLQTNKLSDSTKLAPSLALCAVDMLLLPERTCLYKLYRDKNYEIETMKSAIEILELELKSKIDVYEINKSKYSESLDAMNSDLQFKDDKIINLERLTEELNEKISKYEQKYHKVIQEEVNPLSLEIEQLKSLVAEKDSKLIELDLKYLTEKQESEKAIAKHVENLTSQYTAKEQQLKSDLSEAESKFFELNINFQEKINQITIKNSEIESLKLSLSNQEKSFQKTIEEIESTSHEVRSELELNNSKEIGKLRAKITELNNLYANHQKDLLASDSAYEASLKSIKEDYEGRYEQLKLKYKEELLESESKIKELSEKILNLNSVLKDKDILISESTTNFNQEIDLLKSNIYELKNNESKYKSELSSKYESEKNILENNLSEINSKYNQLNETYSNLVKENDSLKKYCETIKSESISLRSDAELNHVAELSKLRSKISELNGIISAGQKELIASDEAHEAKLLEMKKEFDRRVEKIRNEANDEFHEKQEELNHAVSENLELKSQLKLASLSTLGQEAEVQKIQNETAAKIKNLQSEYDSKILSYEEALKTNNLSINELNMQLTNKDNEIVKCKLNCSDLAKINSELLVQCKSLENELKTHTQTIDELTSQLNGKNTEIDSIKIAFEKEIERFSESNKQNQTKQTEALLLEKENSLTSEFQKQLEETKLQFEIEKLNAINSAKLEFETHLKNEFQSDKEAQMTSITNKYNDDLEREKQKFTLEKNELAHKLSIEISLRENLAKNMEENNTSLKEMFDKKLEKQKETLRSEWDSEKKVEIQNVRDELKALVDKSLAEKEEYYQLYIKENKARKSIHNKLIELQGNIRVICRVRPVLDVEKKAGQDQLVTEFPTDEDVIITKDNTCKMKFEFDRVFTPSSSQEEVFMAVQPLCVSVLDGYNVCIFAYGQTGSGKTYTMDGYADSRGVIHRAIEELFEFASKNPNIQYTFKITMLEIYNETINDLLVNPNSSYELKLEVRHSSDGSSVMGLTEIEVGLASQVFEVLERGRVNRAVGSHNMNEHSSRSHSILTVLCKGVNVDGTTSVGKLNLIDLAGSERLSKTDATGDRLKEAQNINRSLSALGDVINALGNKKSTHVPYRNSKLTYLLQDSLGGNSKVMMIVAVSPAMYNVGETICSLNFASRCRLTELGQATKQIIDTARSTASNRDLSPPTSLSRKTVNSAESERNRPNVLLTQKNRK